MSSIDTFKKMMRAHVITHGAASLDREAAINVHMEGVSKYDGLLPEGATVGLLCRSVWRSMSYLDKIKWLLTHFGSYKRAAAEMMAEIEEFNKTSVAYMKAHSALGKDSTLPMLLPPLWLEPTPFKTLSFELVITVPKDK